MTRVLSNKNNRSNATTTTRARIPFNATIKITGQAIRQQHEIGALMDLGSMTRSTAEKLTRQVNHEYTFRTTKAALNRVMNLFPNAHISMSAENDDDNLNV